MSCCLFPVLLLMPFCQFDETRFVTTTDLLFPLCVCPVQEQHIVALGIM